MWVVTLRGTLFSPRTSVYCVFLYTRAYSRHIDITVAVATWRNSIVQLPPGLTTCSSRCALSLNAAIDCLTAGLPLVVAASDRECLGTSHSGQGCIPHKIICTGGAVYGATFWGILLVSASFNIPGRLSIVSIQFLKDLYVKVDARYPDR